MKTPPGNQIVNLLFHVLPKLFSWFNSATTTYLKKSITIPVLFILLQCSLYYGCTNGDMDEIGKAMHKNHKIGFGQDTLYVKASVWGLTGDYIQIIFSPYPFESKNFDSNVCIKYFESTVYYKKNGDTLELYPTMKSDLPEKFNSNIKIKQTSINKLQDIHAYKEKYKDMDLRRLVSMNEIDN